MLDEVVVNVWCVCVLLPLIQRRNELYRRFCLSRSPEDGIVLRQARAESRRAIVAAKEKWLGRQAAVVEASRFSAKSAWNAIRAIKTCYGGLMSTPSQAFHGSDGDLCSSRSAVLLRWHQHFSSVLNVMSTFATSVFDSLPSRGVDESLAEAPSEEEIGVALRQLQNGKAPGRSGIVSELLKYGEAPLSPYILDLFRSIWLAGAVPQEWRDAQLIPIPKKGDLSLCDNWRGISLLDVVGKLLGRLLQNRLQSAAEAVLPEAQCGFRPGRGCSDAIFTVRHLVEKAFEHRVKLFCLFIDLRKAYDSVPRLALWRAMEILGIPPTLIAIVRSFHDGMEASVLAPGGETEPIQVRNGLRQGCIMAPVLFNLYLTLVVVRWRSVLRGIDPGIGVDVRFKIDGKLFLSSARRSVGVLDATLVSDVEYADDAAFVTHNREPSVLALSVFYNVAAEFGLTLNIPKTKFVVAGVGVSPDDLADIPLGDGVVQAVPSFVYLGSVVTPDCRSSDDITRRLSLVSRAFGSLREVFLDRNLSIHTKRLLYNACVMSILLYGSECWCPLRRDLQRLDGFYHHCIRVVLCVSRQKQWDEHLSNYQLRTQWGDAALVSETK